MIYKNFRNKRFRSKKRNIYKLFFLIVMAMTLGYAALTTTLQMIGTLNIARTTWDIHWDNPTKTGGVTATSDVALKSGDTTTVEYQVRLENPGDYYEFTVDAVNNGTIDGMITNISNKVYENQVEVNPAFLESSITYSDDIPLANNHLLAAGQTETYKVRVQYKTGLTADQLPDTEKTYNYRFTVRYMQADENANEVRLTFSYSSWDNIISAYEDGNLTELQEAMENGTTREVKLDLNHDGTRETTAHLRIANLSECENGETSETACGFVIEFVEGVIEHRMNPYTYAGSTTNGIDTKGGWEYSDMRAYLNGTIYLEGEETEIDYTDIGFIDALPNDLKSKIIDTVVVSSHGSNDSSNFTTTDKLYLLSTKEVLGQNNQCQWSNDTGCESSGIPITRQLDYYETIGVTGSSYSGAIKYDLNETARDWWLRSAYSGHPNRFYVIGVNGDWSTSPTNHQNTYASPVFRIAPTE